MVQKIFFYQLIDSRYLSYNYTLRNQFRSLKKEVQILVSSCAIVKRKIYTYI